MQFLKYLSYSEVLNNLAVKGINELFPNSDAKHAAIVFTVLARTAKSYIHSVCGSMTSDVNNSEEYLKQLEDFLKKGGEFKAILTNFDENKFKNTKIAAILKKFSKQVELKTWNGENGKKIHHFTVADDKIFRLEINRDSRTALVNFNEPKKAEKLEESFNKYFGSSKAVPIVL